MKHGVQNEVGYAYSSNESKSYLITTLHLLVAVDGREKIQTQNSTDG